MSSQLRSEYAELHSTVMETLLMKISSHLSNCLSADGFDVPVEKLNEYLNRYGEEAVAPPKKTKKKVVEKEAPAKPKATKKKVEEKAPAKKGKVVEPVEKKTSKKDGPKVLKNISNRKMELELNPVGDYLVHKETRIAFSKDDHVAVGVLGKDNKTVKKLSAENVKFLEAHNIEIDSSAVEKKPAATKKPKQKEPEPEPEEEVEEVQEAEAEEDIADPDEEDVAENEDGDEEVEEQDDE